MDTTLLVALVGTLGTLSGAGGVIAWFKLGPERGQISVSTASEAVIVHSSVLKDVKAEYQSVKEELAQTKLEISAVEAAHESCRNEIGELRVQISFLQRDLERHGRLSELSRRKTHLSLNA